MHNAAAALYRLGFLDVESWRQVEPWVQIPPEAAQWAAPTSFLRARTKANRWR